MAQVTRKVNVLIVDCPSSYNVILGRPTFNHLKAVTSTYYFKVKFLTLQGIKEICGHQVSTWECYQVVFASKENQTWMVEEEPIRPIEDLKDVELVKGDPSKITKMGGELQQVVKEEIVKFLKNNLDIFALSHEDMPSIHGSLTEHHLSVNSKKNPV